MPTDFRNSFASMKVPRFRPMYVWLRAAGRQSKVRSTGGMILTNKTKALAEKTVAMSFCPPRRSQELSWDRTRAL
jgi:hypothetical protein